MLFFLKSSIQSRARFIYTSKFHNNLIVSRYIRLSFYQVSSLNWILCQWILRRLEKKKVNLYAISLSDFVEWKSFRDDYVSILQASNRDLHC